MEPIDRIDRYLSNELTSDEATAFEQELARNPDLRHLFDSLLISQRAVQVGAIRADVRQVHAQFMTQLRAERAEQDANAVEAKVIPLNSSVGRSGALGWVVRIAASVLLAVLGFGGYQLATVSEEGIYGEKFVGYQLPTTRGTDDLPSRLESRYRAGDFAGVVQQARTLPTQRPPDYFLTGVAHLELRQYESALAAFGQLQQANRQRVTPYFSSETEYYQALAYLGAKQYEPAYALFSRIYEDANHPYHAFVSRTDLWKLKLIAWKK
ncbi:tetratricopeptide repeat protein [Spirosoma montaniterrae]|uniref:Uncharacterized protein n=1 Tax=Spirosoma montaniterrae TaxID=1178516 RepID=A0A1P9WTE1_9BACT|nr:hypothetical protein [Spirosoma montaniterrae]AQG78639.1 hypothetical protein AWR27_04385 [Spirosoma montaniterrae]